MVQRIAIIRRQLWEELGQKTEVDKVFVTLKLPRGNRPCPLYGYSYR
jgi:hypothetical protein